MTFAMRVSGLPFFVFVFVFVFVLTAAGRLSAEPIHGDFPAWDSVPGTVVQGELRPLRGERGDFDPSLFPFRSPPPAPLSEILVPENLDREATRNYIARYTAPNGIAWLHSVIRNGNTFIPFVRAEVERRGLPPELAFVPFVESEYNGTALSRSGASGIWQFMMNSVEPFGLRVNDFVDERRDFRRATDAALSKLDGHRRTFGNWAMAFAAYNMGPNGLKRAVASSGTNDYWELASKGAISRETAGFVPRIVAISYVLSNARRFGVDWWPSGVEWTAIIPGRPVSLDVIASETGMDRRLLRRLNLELVHGITPADPSREIVVPSEIADEVVELLGRDGLVLVSHHLYRVQPGDTLSVLARHYGISVGMIERQNPGLSGRHLRPGEALVIPVVNEVAPFERPPETVTISRPFDGTHVVVQGDTLWSLSRLHNVSLQELAAANGMEMNQTLSIGRSLKVPIIGE